MTEKSSSLIDFALQLFASALRKDLPSGWASLPGGDRPNWDAYQDAIGAPHKPAGAHLRRIFDLIAPVDSGSAPESTWPLCRLDLGETIFSPARVSPSADVGQEPAALFDGFSAEYSQLRRMGLDGSQLFSAFTSLLQKWAWCIPSSRCGEGVSLFEEWKAVAALAFASGDGWQTAPAERFCLVGGDIPGIQDFIYTLASRGAVRSLRGRSFFIQLLGDAVVRRLLDDLRLSPASVIYAAGGNFMLLAPASDTVIEGRTVADRLERTRLAIDGSLLEHFEGDLSVCIDWDELPLAGVFNQDFAQKYSRSVKDGIARRKAQRFASLAASHYETLFAPDKKPGNQHCTICQRMLSRSEGELRSIAGQDALVCGHCQSFEDLARRLVDAGAIAYHGQEPAVKTMWQAALFAIDGRWVDMPALGKPLRPGEARLLVNSTDFIASRCQGFRFMANTAPRVIQADIDRQGDLDDDDEERIEVGQLRSFAQLARLSRGIKKLGFLRMDVDRLGSIFGGGLRQRGMAETSTLSSAVNLFFSGWINRICVEVNTAAQQANPGRGDCLYVIFAGGDDLFVVGSWDLMPELAETVQRQFRDYTGANPAVHLSGGLVIEDEKFPLYQAYQRAGEAESAAKDCVKDGVDRNAFTFLGQPVKWEDWPSVLEKRAAIQNCLGPGKASEALVQNILNIYNQYEAQVNERRLSGAPAKAGIIYGPWMWRAAYSLSRTAQTVKDRDAAKTIRGFIEDAETPLSLTHLALAARWVELLRRKE